MATFHWGMLTHLGWKREWQWVHSSSGIPDTPGQKGEQGVKAERSGGGAEGAEGAEGLALLTGRPAVTGDCRLPGVTGRIDTPAIILQILAKYYKYFQCLPEGR